MDKSINIELRPTNLEDLETLFKFQLDKDANYLAAFTAKDPTDKTAYIKKHSKLLLDQTITQKTIYLDHKIVGSVTKFIINSNAEITYWIDKNYWNKGIATKALKLFLSLENTRPIFGRVAYNNLGSKKVLENCNFIKIGTENGFSNARQKTIREFIYRLN